MTAEFTVAVHALTYLCHKGCVVSSSELADNICTNPARVRKIMSKLVRAGLAYSGAGKGSGYAVGPACRDISLDQILSATGDDVVKAAWHSGDMDAECLVSSGMGGIMDDICSELDAECRKKLSCITIGSISDTIFGGDK